MHAKKPQSEAPVDLMVHELVCAYDGGKDECMETIADQLALVIIDERRKGRRLDSWCMTSVVQTNRPVVTLLAPDKPAPDKPAPDKPATDIMVVETIVAVFVRGS